MKRAPKKGKHILSVAMTMTFNKIVGANESKPISTGWAGGCVKSFYFFFVVLSLLAVCSWAPEPVPLFADDDRLTEKTAPAAENSDTATSANNPVLDPSKMVPVTGVTRVLSAGNLKETTVRVESMKRLAEALKRMSEEKKKTQDR